MKTLAGSAVNRFEEWWKDIGRYLQMPWWFLRVIRWGKSDTIKILDEENLFSKEAINQTSQILDQNIKTLKKLLQPLSPLWRDTFSHFMINAIFNMIYDRRKKETFEIFQWAYYCFRLIYNKICHSTKEQRKEFLKYFELYEQNWINSGWQSNKNNISEEVKVVDSKTWKIRLLKTKKRKLKILKKERELLVTWEISGTMVWVMKWILIWDFNWVMEQEEWDTIITTKINQKNQFLTGKFIWEFQWVFIWEFQWYVKWKIDGNADCIISTYTYGLKKMLSLLEEIRPYKWKVWDCCPFLDESKL